MIHDIRIVPVSQYNKKQNIHSIQRTISIANKQVSIYLSMQLQIKVKLANNETILVLLSCKIKHTKSGITNIFLGEEDDVASSTTDAIRTKFRQNKKKIKQGWTQKYDFEL